MILLISLTIALLSFLLVILVALSLKNSLSTNIFHRMRRHNVKPIIKKDSELEGLIVRFYRVVKQLAKPLVERNFANSLEYKLNQAGIPLLGGEYVVINLIGTAIIGLIIWLIAVDVRVAGIGAAMVPVALWMLILMLKDRRLNSFTEQLGDCLITISNALRAGYSFQQTIEVISREMEPPIGEEFSRINHDIVMGVPLEEALDAANKRIGSPDFELVVTAVLIQREVGGNLAQVLDNISYTINERIRMKREIMSITAQGRLSSIVLIMLPIGSTIVMYTIDQEGFMRMLNDPIGQYAVAIAVILEVIGFIVIRRIVSIEF